MASLRFADVLAPLVHHPPAVGSAHAEARLAHLGKQGAQTPP